MKRFLSLLVLLFAMVQLPSIPALANGDGFISCPSVTTLAATNVTESTATLNGTINIPSAKGGDGSNLVLVSNAPGYQLAGAGTIIVGNAYFQYGLAPGIYAWTTAPVAIPIGKPTFSIDIAGLDRCTTYFARAVFVFPQPLDYHPGPADSLLALLSTGSYSAGARGLGTGFNAPPLRGNLFQECPSVAYGNEINFTTTGCMVNAGWSSGQSGSVGATSTSTPTQLSNIIVQSAFVASTKVSPGEKVDVTATVTNKGIANGATKVTLYVNNEMVESQGVALAGGQSKPLHFYVSRNEPGTYSVYVGSVPAGSFTVDLLTNNDILIYVSIALVTLGMGGILYMVTRRRA